MELEFIEGNREMTMIEKVARAIFNDFQETQDGHLKKNKWEDSLASQPYFISAAKAAIEAMREPTEEMIDAGAYDLDITIKTQYQAMIDQALKDG